MENVVKKLNDTLSMGDSLDISSKYVRKYITNLSEISISIEEDRGYRRLSIKQNDIEIFKIDEEIIGTFEVMESEFFLFLVNSDVEISIHKIEK